MNRVPPRPFVVHMLVVSLLLAFGIAASLITLYGTIIVVGLACIFVYFVLYKVMDRFYGWYLKEKAKENVSTEGAGGASGHVIVEIPTCPKCGDIFKSRSFHEPKSQDGWSLCDVEKCPFETRPLVPRE